MTDQKYTTLSLRPETKERLAEQKIIPAESYDDCLNRILDEYEDE